MLCPRRAEGMVPKFLEGTEDSFKNGACSFCGSLSPDEFFRRVEAGAEVVPTDKNYKVYVASPENCHAKFYFQHLSVPEMERFFELYSSERMKLGEPGRFYVLPYFLRPADEALAAARSDGTINQTPARTEGNQCTNRSHKQMQ